MSVVELNGEEVLKVERNFEKTPFEINNLEAMVDEATIIKLKGLYLENGGIKLKVLSRIKNRSPSGAHSFIGLAFKINDGNSAFESIYFRPNVGKSEVSVRNHTVQYFANPDHKFERLRNPEYRGFKPFYPPWDVSRQVKMKKVSTFRRNGHPFSS